MDQELMPCKAILIEHFHERKSVDDARWKATDLSMDHPHFWFLEPLKVFIEASAQHIIIDFDFGFGKKRPHLRFSKTQSALRDSIVFSEHQSRDRITDCKKCRGFEEEDRKNLAQLINLDPEEMPWSYAWKGKDPYIQTNALPMD